MKWRFLIAAAPLVLGGCGSLNVQVDVLNPGVVENEVDKQIFRETLDAALYQSEGDFRADLAKLRNAHRDAYVSLASAYEDEAKNMKEEDRKFVSGLAKDLIAGFGEEWEPKYRALFNDVWTLNLRVREINRSRKIPVSRTDAEPDREILILLRQRRARLLDFRQAVIEDIGEKAEETAQEIPNFRSDRMVELRKKTEQLQKTVRVTAQTSLLQGQGIVEDPYAYAVASAGDEQWGSRFNRTFGGAYGGNANIAIKLESLGDFTIKGLTFDPSQVARMASKVTTQAVLMTAQAFGVPVRQRATPASGDGAALVASSQTLSDLTDVNQMREAKLQDYKAALVSVGDTIARERTALAGSDEVRARAVAAILAAYNAHKSRLNLDALKGGGK